MSVIVFMVNVVRQQEGRRRRPAGRPDPWDARSLEWMIPSPAPEHNFDEIPTVTQLDEFWHRKYGEDENGRLVRIAATEDVVQKGDATDVHLPSPSYWPLVVAVGLPLIGYGLIFNLAWAVPGVLARAGRPLRLGPRAGRRRREPAAPPRSGRGAARRRRRGGRAGVGRRRGTHRGRGRRRAAPTTEEAPVG